MDEAIYWREVVSKRSDAIEIRQQREKVCSNASLTSLLDTMPHIVLILNHNRQIIWANRCLLETLKKEGMDDLLGLRPGEVFSCVNASQGENGCGTAKECQTCGALLAILESLNEKQSEKECMILTTNNDALNLRIKAGLIDIGGETFDAVSIVDISNEKNKRMLERLFFHDIMNLAGSMQGFANMLPELVRENASELADVLPYLSNGANDLVELIKYQKDLVSAENNELSVHQKKLNAKELLTGVRGLLERNDLFKKRHVIIHDNPEKIHFTSDERLLKRVIVNAVKNALEAVKEGESVELSYKVQDSSVLFEIHNTCYIPEEVQSHIFRKSFSTKSPDRGIGTYSIKLFTEKYLHGKVWFVSKQGEGTTFYIQIPKGEIGQI